MKVAITPGRADGTVDVYATDGTEDLMVTDATVVDRRKLVAQITQGEEVCIELRNRPDADWESIAVALALGGGTYHRLTTPERDALEGAIRDAGYKLPGVGNVPFGTAVRADSDYVI